MSEKLLKIDKLAVRFKTAHGVNRTLREVSFSMNCGETLGIVGESGSGKSVTALSIMGLIPNPPGEITGGEINFAGRDLLKIGTEGMQKIRGNDIAMIFQEPMTSLNPLHTCGRQIMEPLLDKDPETGEFIPVLATEWEWIDDTSNHTHTANQVGRFSCQSQRSANVIVTMTGNTRCCYRTR